MTNDLDAIGTAIEDASSDRVVGLYDYSNYPGEAPPHVVRDERTGERILATWDAAEAEALFFKKRREHLALVAIEAIQKAGYSITSLSSDPR
jgi:hypothetical protein